MRVKAEAIYKCRPSCYFEKHFDAEGRVKREIEGCGAVSFKIISSTRKDGVARLVAEMTEKMDAPAPIRKLLGETTMVEEDSTWKEGTNVIKVVYRPEKMRNKISMSGEFRCEPHGQDACKVFLDLEINVKIFGLGGTIEKMVAKDIPGRLERDAVYFNEQIAPSAEPAKA